METGDDSQLESSWEETYVGYCRDYAENELRPAEVKIIEPMLEIADGRSWGYADLLHLDLEDEPVLAQLVDWKFGWNRIAQASVNMQGIGYALGVFEKYPSLRAVEVHLVMPRLGYVTTHVFTRDGDFDRMWKLVNGILDHALLPFPENFKASAKACAFCARKPTCPVIVSKVAGACNDGLPLPDTGLEDASPEDLALYRDFADIAESWAKKVKEFVLNKRVMGGVDIPGWDLEHRRGARKVVDGPKIVEIARAFGLTEADVIESSKLYLTKLEKKVRDVGKPKDMAHELPADYDHKRLISYGADGRLSVDPDIAGLTKIERAKLFHFAIGDAVVAGDETPVLKRVRET